jgi:hypothetical protein
MTIKDLVWSFVHENAGFKVHRIGIKDAQTQDNPISPAFHNYQLVKGNRYLITCLGYEDKDGGRKVNKFIIKINRNGRIVKA